MGKLGQSAFLRALAAGAECRALTPLAQGKMPSILRRRSWALPEVPLRRRLFLLAAAGLLPLALMSGLGLLVRVPVLRDGEPRLVLTGVLMPQAIVDVIKRQRVPEDWLVSVFDAQGMRVARSRAHERYLGTPASPSLQALMAGTAAQGAGKTQSLEGDSVWTAYTRSSHSRWSVTIRRPSSAGAAASAGTPP